MNRNKKCVSARAHIKILLLKADSLSMPTCTRADTQWTIWGKCVVWQKTHVIRLLWFNSIWFVQANLIFFQFCIVIFWRWCIVVIPLVRRYPTENQLTFFLYKLRWLIQIALHIFLDVEINFNSQRKIKTCHIKLHSSLFHRKTYKKDLIRNHFWYRKLLRRRH